MGADQLSSSTRADPPGTITPWPLSINHPVPYSSFTSQHLSRTMTVSRRRKGRGGGGSIQLSEWIPTELLADGEPEVAIAVL